MIPNAFKAIRTNAYFYTEYDTGEREFYDLVGDPYQLENLVNRLEDQFLQSLSDWLAKLDVCQGKGCWKLEAIPSGLERPIFQK